MLVIIQDQEKLKNLLKNAQNKAWIYLFKLPIQFYKN
jgi:hypothetical protein